MSSTPRAYTVALGYCANLFLGISRDCFDIALPKLGDMLFKFPRLLFRFSLTLWYSNGPIGAWKACCDWGRYPPPSPLAGCNGTGRRVLFSGKANEFELVADLESVSAVVVLCSAPSHQTKQNKTRLSQTRRVCRFGCFAPSLAVAG